MELDIRSVRTQLMFTANDTDRFNMIVCNKRNTGPLSKRNPLSSIAWLFSWLSPALTFSMLLSVFFIFAVSTSGEILLFPQSMLILGAFAVPPQIRKNLMDSKWKLTANCWNRKLNNNLSFSLFFDWGRLRVRMPPYSLILQKIFSAPPKEV